MIEYFRDAIVRILDAGGRPVGAGCLVREHLVATCAHVVADALEMARDAREAPLIALRLDFPFIKGSACSGKVVLWWPYRAKVAEDSRHDLALLELTELHEQREPARLLKPGHERSGPIWAYGFPERAALGELGDWVEGRLAPPLPNGWLKLLQRQEREAFIEPGCSGGPVVIEDAGVVAGIVSLRRKRSDAPEAYGIAAAAIREALTECRAAARVTRSVGQQQDELRAAIAKLLEAANGLLLNRNTPGQLAQEVIAIGEMMHHCVERDLTPERLADLATANEDLADFALRVRREELDCFFEDAPLRGIVDRLDELTSKVPTALVTGGEVPVDHTETERADIRAILELRQEVEAVQATLEGDGGRLEAATRERAWRGLQELKTIVTKPRLSLRRLNEARARLEAIKANLLERTTRLTRVVLGHHAARLPDGAVFQDHEDTPALVIIPSGWFLMGSPEDEEDRNRNEGPQHPVTIARRFALGRYPITFEEYDRFADATGHERAGDEGWGRGRRPVINVSWEDAQAYLAYLRRETGRPYRLPSETEWEYACRAGTTTPFSTGATIGTAQANFGTASMPAEAGVYAEDVYEQDVYEHAASRGERHQTSPVDAFPANPWGLHDMHGNVFEWCEDCWNDNYEGAPDNGSAWLSGDCARRVVRGGSWFFNPGDLRSANRLGLGPDDRSVNLGFRVARTLFTP